MLRTSGWFWVCRAHQSLCMQLAAGADVPEWVQFANNTQYGFSTMVANRTDLDVQFIRADNGQVMDQLHMRKQ